MLVLTLHVFLIIFSYISVLPLCSRTLHVFSKFFICFYKRVTCFFCRTLAIATIYVFIAICITLLQRNRLLHTTKHIRCNIHILLHPSTKELQHHLSIATSIKLPATQIESWQQWPLIATVLRLVVITLTFRNDLHTQGHEIICVAKIPSIATKSVNGCENISYCNQILSLPQKSMAEGSKVSSVL
jgi:hypothetical protein